MPHVLYVYAIARAGHPAPKELDVLSLEAEGLCAFYAEVDAVDFSQAVPAERPGLLRRLLGRLSGRRSDESPTAEAAGEETDHGLALGETGRKPYVWLVEAESEPEAEASGPDGFEPSEPAVAYNGSRAA